MEMMTAEPMGRSVMPSVMMAMAVMMSVVMMAVTMIVRLGRRERDGCDEGGHGHEGSPAFHVRYSCLVFPTLSGPPSSGSRSVGYTIEKAG